MSRPELAQRIMQAQRTALVHSVVANDALARKFGLNPVDLQALHLLVLRQQEITPRDLARQLAIPPSTATRMLDRLEQRGFISRRHDDADRRRVIVTLITDAIHPIVEHYQQLTPAFERTIEGFDDSQLETIMEYLEASQSVFKDQDDH